MVVSQIREYVIESRIGRGGMGSVYLATHIHLGTKAALNVQRHPKRNFMLPH